MAERVRIGLRPRLVAGLLATSAVTLLSAALVLLPPLEQRVRKEQLASLAAIAETARSPFGALGSTAALPRSPQLRALAGALNRRAGARVIVADAGGRVLMDTDEGPTPLETARASLRSRAEVRRISASPDGPIAETATPIVLDGHPAVVVLRRPLQVVAGVVRLVREAFIVAAVIGLGAALLVGTGIATTMSRRLRRLNEAVASVGIGAVGVGIPQDDSRDEVGALNRAFADMQERLRRQEDARRAFVSTASHELRTPIASLIAMLELAEMDLDAQPPRLDRAAEEVTRARRQADRLAGLARDLLDLSRLDAAVPLRQEPVDIDALARVVVAEFADRAGGERVTLRTAPAAELRFAWADPGSVARIIRTLIHNALSYAGEDAAVTVETAHADSRVTVTVSDTGPGIAPAEREAIFERFRRGAGTGGTPGFGLGLAIARELARRLGGDLELATATHGARFVLTLPESPLADPVGGRPSKQW